MAQSLRIRRCRVEPVDPDIQQQAIGTIRREIRADPNLRTGFGDSKLRLDKIRKTIEIRQRTTNRVGVESGIRPRHYLE